MKLLSTTFQRLGTLLSADTASIGTADGLNIDLIGEPFTPGPATDYAALAQPDNAGLKATLAAGATPQNVAIDPATGNQVVTLKDPAGGWRWLSNATGTMTYPVVVYGYRVQNGDNNTPYCGDTLPGGPVTVTANGQQIEIGSLSITLNPAAVS